VQCYELPGAQALGLREPPLGHWLAPDLSREPGATEVPLFSLLPSNSSASPSQPASLGRKCLSNRACSHTCTHLCVEVQQTQPCLRSKFSYCSNFHLPLFTSCLSILLYMTTLQGTKHCDGLDLPTGSKRTETETCPLCF